MNNKLAQQLMLLIFLNLQACASIAEGAYNCPEKISVKSTILHVPDDWKAQNSSTYHFLVSSTFSEGHPSQQGFLRPSKIINGPDSKTGIDMGVYDLSNMSNESAWLICRYGNTPAILIKKLSKHYSTCRVSFPKDASEQKVVCKE